MIFFACFSLYYYFTILCIKFNLQLYDIKGRQTRPKRRFSPIFSMLKGRKVAFFCSTLVPNLCLIPFFHHFPRVRKMVLLPPRTTPSHILRIRAKPPLRHRHEKSRNTLFLQGIAAICTTPAHKSKPGVNSGHKKSGKSKPPPPQKLNLN